MFVKQKCITHVTSSPHYALGNGKSENAVKTLKLLFAKLNRMVSEHGATRLDKYAIRRYEHESCSTIHGSTVKMLLPTAGTLLKPRYDTDEDTRALAVPCEKTWTPGTCTEQFNSRNYRVKVGGTVYTRNRRQLMCAGEEPRDETSRDDATSRSERDDPPLSLSDRIPETHPSPVVPDVLTDLRKPPARLRSGGL